METLFDVVYLTTVITVGILMIRGCKGNAQFRLFGWMAVVLGAGDAFHLIPRAVARAALLCLAQALSDHRPQHPDGICVCSGRSADSALPDAAKSVAQR